MFTKNKLRVADLKDKNAHVAGLGAAQQLIEKLFQQIEDDKIAAGDISPTIQAALDELYGEINTAVVQYNELVESSEGWVSTMHDEMEETIDSRSDEWREGEWGELVVAWSEDWDKELTRIDDEKPESLDDCDFSAIDELNDLPESAY